MYRNDMYDYLKEHAYISKNKKSNYQFELSEERAECIANKFNSLVIDLYQNQWLGRIQDLEQENQELKKQLEYLHGEEYLNQLRFERNMLQDVVDKMEVSKEDKRFIDMTHRNTELLEENRELNIELDATKELVEEHVKKEIDLKEINKDISKGLQKVSIKRNKWKKRYYTERRKNQELHEQLSNSHQINAQQNEFIEYLNKYIKERRRLSKLHKEYSLSEERLSAQCHVLENVLLKYKEIIGVKDE